jgi:hypothetical protein
LERWGLLSVPTGHDSYNQYASHAAQYQEQDPNLADKFQSSFKAFVGWIRDLAFDANAWIAAARSSCSLRLSCLPLSPGSKTKRQNLN